MVRTIPNQSSTTIMDEKPPTMSGALCGGMTAVAEPTMQSAYLIDECGTSILRIGCSHGGTIRGERSALEIVAGLDYVARACMAGRSLDGKG